MPKNASAKSRPKRSPAHMLILALINERPGHRYEIAIRYERRFGGLLPTSGRSAIYRICSVLAEGGLVEEEPIERDPAARGAVAKIRYYITSAGKQALHCWLPSPLRDDWRAELLARMDAGSSVLGVEGTLGLLSRYEHLLSSTEERLQRRHIDIDEAQDDLARLTRLLVVEEQLQLLAAGRDWITDARRELGRYSKPGTGRWPGRSGCLHTNQ